MERIAKDSPEDYWTIVEVLTAYVRQHAPWPPAAEGGPVEAAAVPENGTAHQRPRADVQAALTVLGRRVLPGQAEELYDLDLRRTDLRGADLAYASFDNADLSWSRLDGADLTRAQLTRTILQGVCLRQAVMMGTRLEGADLTQAEGLTAAQIASAHVMGEGALLPPE